MKRLNYWFVGAALFGLAFWLLIGSCIWRRVNGHKPGPSKLTAVSMASEKVSSGD